ncbi:MULTISPECIES: hypothetical protein [unclassified Duganella]|uniref:hypothetical protein n=1 Tax=unclassified Duganella TaxID=2636909 RepID=UPI0011C14312|nr:MULTISPECIES: hypothetical protein [unclassified Duganella]
MLVAARPEQGQLQRLLAGKGVFDGALVPVRVPRFRGVRLGFFIDFLLQVGEARIWIDRNAKVLLHHGAQLDDVLFAVLFVVDVGADERADTEHRHGYTDQAEVVRDRVARSQQGDDDHDRQPDPQITEQDRAPVQTVEFIAGLGLALDVVACPWEQRQVPKMAEDGLDRDIAHVLYRAVAPFAPDE